MRPSIIICSALLLGLASCKQSTSLRYLDAYVGKEPASSGLWDSEPLHHHMKDLMGDQYDHFMQYMKSARPLIKGAYLYSYSRIAQDSTRGYAYILVDTQKDKIQASIETNYQIQKFQDPGEAFTTPADLQSKLEQDSAAAK